MAVMARILTSLLYCCSHPNWRQHFDTCQRSVPFYWLHYLYYSVHALYCAFDYFIQRSFSTIGLQPFLGHIRPVHTSVISRKFNCAPFRDALAIVIDKCYSPNFSFIQKTPPSIYELLTSKLKKYTNCKQ